MNIIIKILENESLKLRPKFLKVNFLNISKKGLHIYNHRASF